MARSRLYRDVGFDYDLTPPGLKDIPVQRNMLIAKLHRVTVTQADPNYVGSVTIDRTLLDAARLPDGFGLEASGTPRGQD